MVLWNILAYFHLAKIVGKNKISNHGFKGHYLGKVGFDSMVRGWPSIIKRGTFASIIP